LDRPRYEPPEDERAERRNEDGENKENDHGPNGVRADGCHCLSDRQLHRRSTEYLSGTDLMTGKTFSLGDERLDDPEASAGPKMGWNASL